MATRIDQIIKLIQEEAKERGQGKATLSKLYAVQLDIWHRVMMIIKAIHDEEREKAQKKGGG